MGHYQPPLRDIRFVTDEMLNIDAHYASLPGCEEATSELRSAIFEEAAKFVTEELVPLNAIGDQQGCQLLDDGEVKTPDGFKEAYQKYVEGGWPSLEHAPEHGGQGLPMSLGLVVRELLGTANWAWSMYPGLSHGAMETLHSHGTEEQQKTYLNPLVSGKWTGTMCLTESHCGTDLGMLKTKAEPNPDGSYRISGSKIFISAGEHDMAENIVHIVLARIAGAPEGTGGISLFIVPKYLPDESGEPGERNAVRCGALEHKMGIHGNATCVLNFDEATGFLIGEQNRGLAAMFTFMNVARIGTGLQGLAHSEFAFQNSLAYARERLQMRSLTGPKNAAGPADPIIVHPDVRRMLLTQKAFAEGGRALLYYTATLADKVARDTDETRRNDAQQVLGLLTPIVKAFLTETGFESANLGLQCFGGHGYIREWGVEQNVRDARIAMLYEGTTGIQALDLLGRKVLGSKGAALKPVVAAILDFCALNKRNPVVRKQVKILARLTRQWRSITRSIGFGALRDRDTVGAAAVDYLMYSGYLLLGYAWVVAAAKAQKQLDAGSSERDFYQGKIETAHFYFDRIMPRCAALKLTMAVGKDSLMSISSDQFRAV